jgi:hypothetical protein
MNKITKKEFKTILTTKPSVFIGVTKREVDDNRLKQCIIHGEQVGYESQLRRGVARSASIDFYPLQGGEPSSLYLDKKTTCYETLDRRILVCEESGELSWGETYQKFLYYFVP